MKKVKHIILMLAAVSVSAGAFAQGSPFGVVPGSFGFSPADMYQYSQSYGTFSTARSSAMGGAFTSLGGDLTSIGGNPAGLGMYRSSVWGFSPSLTFTNMTNDYKAFDNDRSRFTFNNIGTVINVSQRSRGLISFSLGFSYNKVADFNYRTGFNLPEGDSSINDIFALQLNGLDRGHWNGIPRTELVNPFSNAGVYLSEWGAALAYQTEAIGPVGNGNLYRVTGIENGAKINPRMQYDSRGSIGEYNLSGGMNINNVLYLGFGLTLQDIYQRQQIGYTEMYNYSGSGGGPSGNSLEYMDYDQYAIVNGAGINFKFGLIARPIPALRIGLAVHTPMITGVTHEYYAGMRTGFYDKSYAEKSTPTNSWNYNFAGPTRLMAGISYTVGNFAVVAADYEVNWYNGMRLRSGEYDVRDYYNSDIKTVYRPSSNIKIGAEIKPVPTLALRAGYSFYGSPLKPEYDIAARFTATDSHGLSAGLGFYVGKYTTIDIAYIYSMTRFATVRPFEYFGEAMYVDAGGNKTYVDHVLDPLNPGEDFPIWTAKDVTRIRQNRHTVTMSFNFIF